MGGKILQWQRVVHVIYDREREFEIAERVDEGVEGFIAAAENGVINLARNIPKRKCIIWLTKYVHKIKLTRKLWVASEHIGSHGLVSKLIRQKE